MATTEEQLDVTIRTVADISGAQEVQGALQRTQQSAQQLQNQLSAGQQGANALMRAVMAQETATLQNFERAVESVTRSMKVAPTLRPEDFGIKADAVTTGAKAAADATRDVGNAAAFSSSNMARFGVALFGLGGALSLATFAGSEIRRAFEVVVDFQTNSERAIRENTIALGQQAASYQAWATVVSRQAGIVRESLLEAGTAAAAFSRQVGLGPGSLENLTGLARILSLVHGLDVGQTMTQLTAAMQGNAGAAQALGLQLDAAYIAFNRLDGASAEVFSSLDPSTQAWLRYQAAVEQTARQAQTATGVSIDLARAQEDLNRQFARIGSELGPPIMGFIAGAIRLLVNAQEAWYLFRDVTIEVLKEVAQATGTLVLAIAGAVGGAIDALGRKVSADLETLLGAARDAVATIGGVVQQAANLIKTITGVDVLEGVQQAISNAGEIAEAGIDRVRQALADLQAGASNYLTSAADAFATEFEGLGRTTSSIADAIAAKFDEIFSRVRQAASAGMDVRAQQLAEMVAAAAGPLSDLAQARDQEIAAAKLLADLRRESVQLGAQEAAKRLEMLPAQQQMLRIQNDINRAQLEATQRAIPATRALQDLQNQIEQQRLIAIDPNRAIAERQAAQELGARLSLQLPGAQLGALQANVAALPAQRAAEDVARAAQVQALDIAKALFPEDFRQQQISLLSQVVDAARQATTRAVQIAVQGVNVIFQSIGPITPEDEKKITELVGGEIAAVIHAAVQQANTRPAPAALIGATP